MAGREALALNRRSLILSNRPDVETSDSRLSKPLTSNEKPVITTRIFNAGKGKAIRLESRGWIHLAPKRVFPYPALASPPSIIDLGSGLNNALQLALTLPFPLTVPMIADIERGKQTLYVYGVSEYFDDTLERPQKHTLHWCSFYDPSQPDKLALAACREHNGTAQ